MPRQSGTEKVRHEDYLLHLHGTIFFCFVSEKDTAIAVGCRQVLSAWSRSLINMFHYLFLCFSLFLFFFFSDSKKQDNKKSTIKYTAQKLYQKGVILEIEGLPESQ